MDCSDDTILQEASGENSTLISIDSHPLSDMEVPVEDESIESQNSQYVHPTSSCVDDSQNSSVSTVNSCTSTSSSILTFRHIQSTRKTDKKCFICNKPERKSVPWSAIRQVWFKMNLFVPKTNRTCAYHLDANNLFTEDAVKAIEAFKQGIYVKSFDFGLWLLEVCDIKPKLPYDFSEDGIPAEKFPMFFGITKEKFDDMMKSLTEMRNSSSRSVRNALAMFLLVLRNNLKQEFIADMFSTTQQVVSQAIDTVSSLLDTTFVPDNLGYHHITREEALEKHSRKLTSGTLQEDTTRLGVIADCTYTFIEKPQDFLLQRKTFSLHKKRNLLKPLFVVFPSGYILEAAGPYFCDSANNDAAIMSHHYENSDLLLFLEEDDFFKMDRGYRDVVEETKSHGISVHMPSLMDRTKSQFTCEEANASRKVTMSRWVIEAVNGRLKNVFPFFKHTIEGSYVPKIMRFVRIACAMLNKYFPPLFTDQDFHDLVVEDVLGNDDTENPLKKELEEKKLIRMTVSWEKATAESLPDFPRLSWDELKRLTLGSFQLKIASRYNQEHFREDPEYGIFLHSDASGLIRAKIQSRHRSSKAHTIWIKYDTEEVGRDAIVGRYCTCQVGERTSGSCSHLAAVLRYLAFDRYEPPKINLRGRLPWDAIDCRPEVVEDADSEPDE